jgi:hypothetical protein
MTPNQVTMLVGTKAITTKETVEAIKAIATTKVATKEATKAEIVTTTQVDTKETTTIRAIMLRLKLLHLQLKLQCTITKDLIHTMELDTIVDITSHSHKQPLSSQSRATTTIITTKGATKGRLVTILQLRASNQQQLVATILEHSTSQRPKASTIQVAQMQEASPTGKVQQDSHQET